MASTACQRNVNKGVVFYVRLAKCSVDACLLVLCFFRSSFVSISNTFSLSLSQPDPALRFPPQQHIPRHSKQVQQHVTIHHESYFALTTAVVLTGNLANRVIELLAMLFEHAWVEPNVWKSQFVKLLCKGQT
jgi:hypothetical protein